MIVRRDLPSKYIVIAEHKSAAQIATDFETAYGFQPKVKVLGTLDDLKNVIVSPDGVQNPIA